MAATANRCIGVVRSATGDSSQLSSQEMALRQFADEKGFSWICTATLDGGTLSGGCVEQLNSLVERKRRNEDFDAIVLTSIDRISRNHSTVVTWIRRFVAAGISIYSADGLQLDADEAVEVARNIFRHCCKGDPKPGVFGWLQASMARDVVEVRSASIWRGRQERLRQGLLPFRRPPIGIDRLYTNAYQTNCVKPFLLGAFHCKYHVKQWGGIVGTKAWVEYKRTA